MLRTVNGWLTVVFMQGNTGNKSEIFRKAIQIYDELIKKTDNKEYYVYKACCFYALCQFDDSKREALKGTETDLQTRVLFHIAHKKNDQKNLMTYHAKIQ